MFDEVLHASDPQAREKPFIELCQLLAVHETAEEMVVHPRMRREFDEGDAVVDVLLAEEHEAKELLSKIEGLDITSQEFIDELTKLRDAVPGARRARGDRGIPQAAGKGRRRRPQAHGRRRACGRGDRSDAAASRRGIGEDELCPRPLRLDARPCARSDQASGGIRGGTDELDRTDTGIDTDVRQRRRPKDGNDDSVVSPPAIPRTRPLPEGLATGEDG